MQILTYLCLRLTPDGRKYLKEVEENRALLTTLNKYHRLAGTGINIKLNKEIR